ncbi:DUF882 domain-containing protein [Methylocapsa sp. S129]|uniref:DUF882 domain-containing protein n=1 Tax=Methylocapsa sp. S129 TaxID=1641869 RepID=UPI00131E8350|nr:DUF882 domain-containing protein [Methylocapsa sp. S129]
MWLSSLAEGTILPALKTFDVSKFGRSTLARALVAPLLLCLGFASNSTESAIANGETRTINLSDSHTNEAGSFTYMVNGVYDSSVLEKLNWFMRDWRHDEKINIDPKLFDIVWEVYRESGSSQPVDVLSGYRSPETNAMLRRRSRQVAEHSQHMLGKAMDAHFLDVPTAKIRDIAMRLQSGGVGFYPTGNTPWVHLDSGSVRYWPRMGHDQIARLFPDGKTVFIPSDGVPLPGYQQAAAEIEARGGAVYAASAESGGPKGLFAMLFGGGEDDAEESSPHGNALIATATPPASSRSGGGAQTFFATQYQVASGAPDAISRAKHDLPHGETYMTAPDSAPTAAIAAASQKPQLVASLGQPGDAGATDAQGATAAQRVAPMPPRRPSDPELAMANAPTPPARPVEFASLQAIAPNASLTRSLGPIPSDAATHKNDLIAALLARKLPGVITRGADGVIPAGALALAEVPEPVARPASLARAAALSATLPLTGSQPLSPLARAALLSAPLPPARTLLKTILVAARIDRSNFTVMTAAPAKTQSQENAAARIVPAAPGARPDVLLAMAMLAPNVEAPAAFAKQPYGDLRADAFTGPAIKPLNEVATADLRGSSQ